MDMNQIYCRTAMKSSITLTNFYNINHTLNRVIEILVKWQNSVGILTKIARDILIKIPVEMCQFTRIPMTRWNVSFMLQNFSQCIHQDIQSQYQRVYLDDLNMDACMYK